MSSRATRSTREGQSLGIDAEITRRDFLNGTLLGVGSVLLTMPSACRSGSPTVLGPEWEGFGGVGDYAISHGNTAEIVNTAHRIRDGEFVSPPGNVIDTGEVYDLVVIGGGIAGLSAARTFLKGQPKSRTCLILENHPLTGGAAKRNEFSVDGHRLTGPQASNATILPSGNLPGHLPGQAPGDEDAYGRLWDELKLPQEFAHQPLAGHSRELRFALDNYLGQMLNADELVDTGYFFGRPYVDEPRWAINSARNGYKDLPFADEKIREDLWRLKQGTGPREVPGDGDRWLDGMTLAAYLENIVDVHPEVTRIYSELMALNCGVGSDAVSALFAKKLDVRFFEGFPDCCLERGFDPWKDAHVVSFPGGNDTIARHFLKAVLPEAISGSNTLGGIQNGSLQVPEFDRQGNRVRIRTRATVIRVEHEGDPESSRGVVLTYHRGGDSHRVRARCVVSAVGAWVNKHVVKGLPASHASAFGELSHGSNLVVNVALRNWRPMAKLGITACHYFTDHGLGIYCNIRQPMIVGDHPPPLDPEKPVVLTFYIGFPSAGPAKVQGVQARARLLGTSYRQFEVGIRQLLNEMFSSVGFDARRDVAGITLNRWGHSYVVPEPGFYYGRDGRPAPKDVISQRFSRIAFGHSELAGVQTWWDAATHGERAARQAMEAL